MANLVLCDGDSQRSVGNLKWHLIVAAFWFTIEETYRDILTSFNIHMDGLQEEQNKC